MKIKRVYYNTPKGRLIYGFMKRACYSEILGDEFSNFCARVDYSTVLEKELSILFIRKYFQRFCFDY